MDGCSSTAEQQHRADCQRLGHEVPPPAVQGIPARLVREEGDFLAHLCCFSTKSGELQSQALIHIGQSCSQDSTAVIPVMQHVLKTLKTEYPEITWAYLRQDNAGCYHCANTVLACPTMEQSTGIKVVRLDFSDPQGGKGAADRLAATSKCHIRIYLNEGHEVTTAEEMREALLSHRGVEGVRVALLPSIKQTVELQKIPGINSSLTDPSGLARVWYRSRKEHCEGESFRSVPSYYQCVFLVIFRATSVF